ncbi:MAG: alpha-1,2-fucosyltransferase [Bacteroidia bacterium]
MIISQLNGGLGNQLFQYAIAKKLALKLNTELVLDLSVFETQTLRKYSLAPFNFNQRFITKSERILFGLVQAKGIEKLYYKVSRKILQPIVIHEKQFNFDEDVFKNAKRNTYLTGYWQTEKYFFDIRKELLADFTINKQLENKNLEFAKRIEAVNSVSLHIRRGDYVSNTDIKDFHGACGLDYYTKAVEFISKHIKNPLLFIFSDDMPWVKENLITTLDTYYIDNNNADTNYEDLRLMSMCKHNIIANSSFSWWGAWLNSNADKIVIAPSRWFNPESRWYKQNKINTVDIIPENWIKIHS